MVPRLGGVTADATCECAGAAGRRLELSVAALLLNDDTIRNWHKLFEQRGIEEPIDCQKHQFCAGK
jgi:hypothetical protein